MRCQIQFEESESVRYRERERDYVVFLFSSHRESRDRRVARKEVKFFLRRVVNLSL